MNYKIISSYILITTLITYSCNSPLKDNSNTLKTKNLSAKEIYAKTVNNTVTVMTAKALGSGFFIDSNIIVTNYHVIEGSDSAKILLNNSDKKYDVIGYLAIDRINDLVLLQIKYKNAGFINISDSMPLPGEKIYAIGSPIGLAKTISEGIISGIRTLEEKKLLQITAPISHGSSGCPILNESGEAVGVAVGGINDANNIGFCVPINFVRTLVDFKEMYALNLQSLLLISKNKGEQASLVGNPADEIPQNKLSSIYLGKHLFNSYSIGDNIRFGSVNISIKNGRYYLNGGQKNEKSWIQINGEIIINNEYDFNFKGKIVVHNNSYNEWLDSSGVNGDHVIPDCEWEGTSNFSRSRGRAYWRMHGGGCYYLTSDVDIFRKTGTK